MNLHKLINELQELLLESKEYIYHLYEMSQPIAEVRKNVRELSNQIIKHICKILLYSKEENQTLHHWCAELDNWFDQCMRKIKGKNRYPNAEELYKWLTDYYSDYTDIEVIRRSIEKQYFYQGHKKRSDISNELLYDNVTKFLKDICPFVANLSSDIEAIEHVIDKYILA